MWFHHFADDSGAGSRPKPQMSTAPQPDANPYAEEIEEDRETDMQRTLETMLPWAISGLMHGLMVVLAMMIVWSVSQQQEDPADPDPAMKVEEIKPSEWIQPDQPVDIPQQSDFSQHRTQELAKETTQTKLDTVDMNQELVIGASSGAKMLPVGDTSGPGEGLGVGFMGAGGNARTIVYVIDASGSLIDTLPYVLDKLRESVTGLKPIQRFAVIFFQDEEILEVPPRGLAPATPANKRRLAEWINPESGNVIPRGTTTPLPAIKQGLTYRPQLMYILSDNITGKGIYAVPQEDLLEQIRDTKAKFDPNTKISAIEFMTRDPLETLKKIATEHKGLYKFIDRSYFGLE